MLFDQVPTALRVPFVAVEVDASQASQGPALLAYRGLLIGQKTSAGTANANTLHRVSSVDQVLTLAGRGSILHREAIAWFAVNRFTELWIAVLADDDAGTAAAGELVFTGPATASGQLALYLGGDRVPVGVASGDTAAEIAEATTAAINAATDLPVTAVQGTDADTHKVAITFRHKGLVGNSYDVRHSFVDGEALPAGVGLTITALANGAGNPALGDLIAALGDSWFHVWAHPYTDATSLTAIEAELASRFGPMRMIDGVAVTSASGTLSALATLGNARNSPHSSVAAQPGVNPLRPPMEHAAEIAGLVALHGQIDPARPFQALAQRHAIAPVEGDRFTLEERNQLLFDGIATTRVGPGETVQLERLITTYQTSAAGSPDTAYLDLTTPLTLLYLRYSFRVRWATRYPRHKLASDGVRAAPGQPIVTPKIGKGEALAWFRDMEELGLVEGYDQFKRDLVVVRNQQNPNRLDFLLPPDLMNQLITTAAKLAFRL